MVVVERIWAVAVEEEESSIGRTTTSFRARSTGQWWERVDGAAHLIPFPKKFRPHKAVAIPCSVTAVLRSLLWVVGVVGAATVTITAGRWSTQRSVAQAEALQEIQLGVPSRRPARWGKVLADPAVQGTGIQVAVAERAARVSAIQLMGDPACWFRFWVAIFTGAGVVEDLGIPSVAETVELEEEVVERLIQTAEEPG